jgi:uncharacterized protein (TIGR03083 family)
MVFAMVTRTARVGWLDFEVYLRKIRSDSDRLAEVGRLGGAADVPSCPGWTVADVLDHVAHVYLHKVELLRTGARPDPWPPPELADREPSELFDEATRTLLDELASRDPDAPSPTFWPPEQSVGFWFRRMALEIAVHRYDAELAHDVPTAVEDDLAVDGIDEALRAMLGGPWWDDFDTEEPLDARIRVTSAGRSWTVTADRRSVAITEGDTGHVAVEIAGSPADVFLWLWGRRGDETLAITGDGELAAALRRRLAEATG